MGIHSPKALVASWELNPHCLMGLMAIEHRTTLMRTVFKTPAEVGSPWCFFSKWLFLVWKGTWLRMSLCPKSLLLPSCLQADKLSGWLFCIPPGPWAGCGAVLRKSFGKLLWVLVLMVQEAVIKGWPVRKTRSVQCGHLSHTGLPLQG